MRRLGDAGKAGATALVLLCVAVAALSIVTAAAQGAVRHLPEPAPSKAISEGLIGLPNAMTVDSGHLWVAADERNAERKIHDRIQEFNASTGALIATFPQISGFENERSHGLAVGHGTGEELIYATDQDDETIPEDNVLAAFDEAGNLKATWTGAKTPLKAFGHDAPYGFGVSGVAVDESMALGDWASGDVYVADGNEGAVDLIKPAADGEEGELIAQLTGPKPGVKFDFNQTISGGDYVAVDEGNGDVAVIDERTSVYVFEPESGVTGSYRLRFEITGTPAGQFTANRVNSVAFDAANGEIFVSENETGSLAVYEFDSAGAFIGKLTGLASGLTSVAVDSEAPGDAYVGGGDEESPNMLVYGPDIVVPNVAVTEPPLKLTPTGVTLRGTVNPNEAGEASCEFEYGTSTEYGHRTKCRSSVPNGNAPVAVESEPITGLAPDTTYHYRLDAVNANKSTNTGEGVEDLGEFHTLGAASDQQDSAQVGAEAATLEARIDPNGSPTTYYFQYGTSNAYGSQAPAAPGSLVGSGHGDVEVAQTVKGLQPNTLYHYRVVTVSELSLEVALGEFETQIQSVYGPDRTFTTTLLEQPFELPDHRQWEMVTPPQSEGALFYPLDPFKNPTLGIAYLGLIQAAADGEAIVDLASRPTEPQPEGYANLVPVLSKRTSGGWVSTVVAPPHAEATSTSAGEGNEYRFFSPDLSEGVVQQFGNGYALSPQATEETPYIHLDYLPGHAGEFCAGSSCYEPLLTAANTPEGAKFGDQGADQTNEHECDLLCGPQFVDATPDLSNVIIESDVPLNAVAGGDELYDWSSGQLQPLYVLPAGEGGGVAQPGPLLSATNNQLAADGRLFFSYDGHLYMQDLDKQATFRLDVAQGVPEPASAGAEFLYASADGSTVFFSDAQQLTSASGGGIYACRIVEEAGSLHCQLSLLSDPGADQVVGTSEDGAYVYVAGAGGVDVAHYDDGGWEATSTGIPSVAAPREGSSTRVSANGLWLAFASKEDLTGYDSRNQVNDEPDEEVYLYGAASNQLHCVSCNPTGERPPGVRSSSLPVWDVGSEVGGNGRTLLPVNQPRFLNDSGEVFFDSVEALVPQDVNGAQDVYEYEPAEVGTCTAVSPTDSERSAGCVGLISSGTSPEESSFLDASESGSDVFFLTEAQLAPQDVDTAPVVYDAHECTAQSPCPQTLAATPPCSTADSCKPPQSPQPTLLGPPATETFSGPGNQAPVSGGRAPDSKTETRAQKLTKALAQCHKDTSKKKRTSCEASARKKYVVNTNAKGKKKHAGGKKHG